MLSNGFNADAVNSAGGFIQGNLRSLHGAVKLGLYADLRAAIEAQVELIDRSSAANSEFAMALILAPLVSSLREFYATVLRLSDPSKGDKAIDATRAANTALERLKKELRILQITQSGAYAVREGSEDTSTERACANCAGIMARVPHPRASRSHRGPRLPPCLQCLACKQKIELQLENGRLMPHSPR